MATDCYLVLGVPRDASVTRIRRAFQRFCHESHADDLDPDRFNDVRDAFETLSDRTSRFRHDLALHGEAGSRARPEPVTSEPVDLMQSFATHHPGREEITDHIARNFTGRGIPKSHPVRELSVELSIAPDAAARGGRLPIDVPVASVCRRCEGSGCTGYALCDDCDGHGLFWDVARVDVLLSPPVRDGAVVPVSLRHLGVQNLYLRVHVRVAA